MDRVHARRLRIRHTTRYVYDRRVRRSVHTVHLKPQEDERQRLLDFELSLDPAAVVVDFEDVFGNKASRFEIHQPYNALTITASSLVELRDVDPFAFAALPIHPKSFPLAWMPWERTMLTPYLTAVELPDTQLREIYDYAMRFVERNHRDLMETLFAINLELFNEYDYVPGSTSLNTSPYQVMHTRRGVCQDFANLFICMARLLNIPARYACGYIYTGNNALSRAQSDATHAWVELYIPEIGWKSFDPTNGVLPHTDHVRVACGRHFRDTAPTAGTFYGYAREKMSIDVSVTDESVISSF
ncbi:MAG: transglutaminase family protein [Phycisphaerae bacterium]|nr:transglutaminase family protein [Phycisphaerae bacterium]